ncbi:MAG: hypothetical protein IMF09_09380 [Proteobacteria bacterium]|nr:hypothetical protein [Pseudomonadota bacterium]
MKNSITVTIPFSFKGVEHQTSAVVDLDSYTRTQLNLDQLFHLVATENGIDRYSYEYEVLESSTLIFSQPTGLAKQFLIGDSLDLEAFSNKLIEENILKTLRSIAKDTLGINKLAEHEKLQQALQQAYQAGLSAPD